MSAAIPEEPRVGRIRLTLDLDPYTVPVTGTLVAASGDESPFTGWVGLTRAIELALAAARSGGKPRPEREP